MLNRAQKTAFILILFCNLFAQMETWSTTRFEKFWFSKVNNMKFRTPFVFMPFNIKVGYFKYGGNKYWDQWEKVINGSDPYKSNPIIYNDVDIWFSDGISKTKKFKETAKKLKEATEKHREKDKKKKEKRKDNYGGR